MRARLPLRSFERWAAGLAMISVAAGCGSPSPAASDAGGGDAVSLHDAPSGDARRADPDGGSRRDSASDADAANDAGSDGAASAGLTASPMFGFSESDTQAAAWPTVSYGMQRFWDSPPLQWPSLNPSKGVFDFTSLDADLSLAFSKGTLEGMYTLARTPPWATSAPTDTNCHYATTPPAVGGGDGECDAPSDLNADGSGTNAIWKAWITAIGTHANDPSYLKSHAHIRYWEIWNEPDSRQFWSGTLAQLARLTEDANCILTGRGVVHDKGDGTSTPCTAKAIDPTALIVMASAHAVGPGLVYGENELYCDDSPTSYQLPCPDPPDAISSAVDVINFHMKPGGTGTGGCAPPMPCSIEDAMSEYVANIEGMLHAADKKKPLWNGEASYSEMGFGGAYTDPDMQASFMPRFFLTSWSIGISGDAWYSDRHAAPSVAPAYQQTYNWMVGAKLVEPCKATGTVWSCTLESAGKQHLILWDSAQTCSSGTCTTAPQTVTGSWVTYEDMTTAGTPVSISGHSVPVGIKPIVLSE